MLELASIPILIAADDPDIYDDPIDEVALDGEDTSEENLRYDISSYGADYDVEGLVKRLKNEDAKIPDFQRGYVWPLKQASRFIESLLLGLPVPGIFLSNEPGTNKLLVIDGHQRLGTLWAFYDGLFPPTLKREEASPDGPIPVGKKVFSLADVQESLLGKTYKTLDDADRRILDNAIIHATVVKQSNPQDGGSGIYKIFERLNSSGMLLSPQEIRTAIYGGRMTKLISELNSHVKWRSLFGPLNKRMRDQELILRFLALFEEQERYTKPMKTFLNNYMQKNRDLPQPRTDLLTQVFSGAIDKIYDALGPKAFKPVSSLNAAIFDSIAVSVAKNLRLGTLIDEAEMPAAYDRLIHDTEFTQWISQSTADVEVIRKRIERASATFSRVS